MNSQVNYPNAFKQNKIALKCYKKFGCVMLILVPLYIIAMFIYLIVKCKNI